MQRDPLENISFTNFFVDNDINNELAIDIFEEANRRASLRAAKHKKTDYGADEIAIEVEKILQPLIKEIRLLNESELDNLIRIIQDWSPPLSDNYHKYALIQGVIYNHALRYQEHLPTMAEQDRIHTKFDIIYQILMHDGWSSLGKSAKGNKLPRFIEKMREMVRLNMQPMEDEFVILNPDLSDIDVFQKKVVLEQFEEAANNKISKPGYNLRLFRDDTTKSFYKLIISDWEKDQTIAKVIPDIFDALESAASTKGFVKK